MIIPVRCFTCNKIIGNKEKIFKKLIEEEKREIIEVWKILKIDRDCCKSLLLSYNDSIEVLNLYHSFRSEGEIEIINKNNKTFYST